MDQKAPSSSKAIFSIRSPLSIFTPKRSKDKDQTSKSPKTPCDPIKEPDFIQQNGNKVRPKKRDSQMALPLTEGPKGILQSQSKPIIPGSRKSEDLNGGRIRYSLFAKTKEEKTQSMPGLDEKFLEKFMQRAESNKNRDPRGSGRGMASRISNFFNKLIPSPRKKDSLSPDSKSPDAKKQIKRVTFAINVHEAEPESPEEMTPRVTFRKRRGTARNDDENIPPFLPQQKHPIDSLTMIPIENKKFEKRNEPREIISRGHSPNGLEAVEKSLKNSKNLELEVEFQPYGFNNIQVKHSPVTPSTSSSINAKPTQLTPLNLGNVLSRVPSDSGSFSPAKEKFTLSPVNLMPIKSNLMFGNKSRRNSCLDTVEEKGDNFDFDTEPNHGAMSHRHMVMGGTKGQTFKQRASEVRSSFKLPMLPQTKKLLA